MTALVLYLLTHSRELQKGSNTGALVRATLASSSQVRVELIQWQRKEPEPLLLDLAASQQLGLIYPLPDVSILTQTSIPCYLLQQGQYQPQNQAALSDCSTRQQELTRHWLLLDATWQEAAKMLRQSPYLQHCYRLAIAPQAASEYLLRRNQRPGALCTAEVVIELLQQLQFDKEKEQLRLLFAEFNRR
jgi:DTW domain-containing protein YfiP